MLYREYPHGTLYNGDALQVLSGLQDNSVHCCVTSPPYWGLRDYGTPGQIGLEKTPEEYVARMVAVFEQVRRVLRDDGTLWLNLGDAYSRYWTKRGKKDTAGAKQKGNPASLATPSREVKELPPKSLIGLPWRVAFALQAAGWYLRCDIIWSKPNPMPESVRDRPTRAHEYIFLLSKSEKYYYDHEAVKEPVAALQYGATPQTAQSLSFGREVNEPERPGQTRSQHRSARAKGNAKTFRGGGVYTEGQSFHNSAAAQRESHGNAPNESMLRNRRSVWTIPTRPFSGAHFATFPPALIEPCILAGCPMGGTVLDPFFGSGTVGEVAQMFRRKWLGIEISADYCELSDRRVQGVPVAMASFDENIFPLMQFLEAAND